MKAIRISLMAVLALSLALGACNIFIFSGAPTVAVNAPKTVLNSGEILMLTASVSHGTAPFSYKWEEDGADLGVDASEYAYSRFVTSSTDVTIKVTVTDSDGDTASATKVVTVVRPSSPGTIRITNNSSYDAYYLYVSPASNGNWGPDQLRPNYVVYSSSSRDLTGVPAGYWDLKMVSIYSTHTWTEMNVHVPASSTYPWVLSNSNLD